MQTMRTKNRTSVAITGLALLALVVGLIVYGVSQRTREEAREIDPMNQIAEPENGINAQSDVLDAATANQAATTPDSTPAIGTPADSASAEATPALTKLGAVPATHKVQPDETLYTISQKYYGNIIYAGDIEQLNNLTDPNQIQVGLELQLPRPEALGLVGQ